MPTARKLPLYVWILAAMLLGLATGPLLGKSAAETVLGWVAETLSW